MLTSFLFSIFPIVLLFALMLVFRVRSWLSALTVLAVTSVLAVLVPDGAAQQKSYPAADTVGWSICEGMLKAVFPILLIIIMAIFSYNVLVESGEIEVIKRQFREIAKERGILVLMTVWGFGGLLEGMAGFGTAVAIPAAMLIGLGFRPLFSATVSLLGNSVVTAFGAVGVPVLTLCNEVAGTGGPDPELVSRLSEFTVIQLLPLFFLVPLAILMMTDRRRWLSNILIAAITGGVTFGVQYLSAVYLGAETPAILGSLASIGVLAVISVVCGEKGNAAKSSCGGQSYSLLDVLRAWSVYALILVFVLFSGSLCPPVSTFLRSHLISRIEMPVIGSVFRFAWLGNAAFWLFAGSVAGGMIQGLGVKRLAAVMGKTLYELRYSALTIICLISLASVMNHTGMIASIAMGLSGFTGAYYPFIAPLIGAVGTFVTGSDTSSNILFGRLQADVASALGMEGHRMEWLVAANTVGATGGKIISPQSIAIATSACGMKGEDDAVLRRALPYALAYIAIAGLVVWAGS